MQFTSQHSNASPFVVATSGEDLDAGKKGSDRVLLAVIIMLMMIGMMAVYSSIAYFAEIKGTTAGTLLTGHIMKLSIAFVVMLIFSKIDYRILARLSKFGLLLSWVFLLTVSLFGVESFGAKRWLTVAGFSFQPSSMAVIALMFHLSCLIGKKQEYIKDFKRTFMPLMLWVLITCGLIGIEDFSSAALLLGMSMLLLFVGRVSVLHLAGLVLLGALGGVALLSQSAERQSRINSYVEQVIHIKSDDFALEDGYQAQQAQIAIARGGLFGAGIGKSSQRDFLPAPYNDFIFAIIAEEYGLFGAGFLMFLYTVILFRGIVFVAKRAEDTTGMLMAVSCTLGIVLYAYVNAAVASGLFPVTGLPMPFVSYGGTSMLFSGMLIGVLLNISKHKRGAHV